MSRFPPTREQDESVDRLFHEYTRALYALFKSSFVFETNNQSLVFASERVAVAANKLRDRVGGDVILELLADGVYGNRVLLKLDPGTLEQADYLYAIWSTLRVAAIGTVAACTAADWLALISVFKRAVGPDGDHAEFARSTHPVIRIEPAVGTTTPSHDLAMTIPRRALQSYATSVLALGDVLEAARLGAALRTVRVKHALQEMISLAEEASPVLLALAHLKRNKLSVAHHLTNTAVFTICAVRSLGLTRAQTSALALHAAVHDLGRGLAVADDSAQGPAAERRYALASVLHLVGAPSASSQSLERAVVANEIRRWADREAEPAGDTAYPYALGGASRIISVAHAYSLLTTPLRHRPALLPDEALRVIMCDASCRFDRTAVKLFVGALGAYPIGSTVRLSDGHVGVVIETAAEGAPPSRASVKLVRDPSGRLIDGERVDLARTNARIDRCIDGEQEDINAPAFLLA